jgi:site-specific DNA-methyltransferase (adenine-specific)
VFLDPPFNLGKRYGKQSPRADLKDPKDYSAFMNNVMAESVRILKPGAALYLYHLPLWAMRLGSKLEEQLELRHWIAVSMKNGFVRGSRLYPAHYALLYFTKGDPKHFHRPRLRPQTCRHCGEFVKDYGGYESIISEKGVNLSDFWDDMSPVRHARTKTRAANELPLALTSRVIEISGYARGLVVDPFAGSGSMVAAAAQRGMRFAACDLELENCELIVSRISALQPNQAR